MKRVEVRHYDMDEHDSAASIDVIENERPLVFKADSHTLQVLDTLTGEAVAVYPMNRVISARKFVN